MATDKHSPPKYPDIQRRNLEQSLYEVFEKHCGVQLTEINQMLSDLVR